MSEWNNLQPSDRITKWKNFRNDIKNLNEETQIEAVANFFATVPVGSRSIDYYTPSNWLSPWEILYEGCYCKSSISLLMYHTLALVLKDRNKIDIALIDDSQDVYLVPVVNESSVLNLQFKTVSLWETLDKDVKIIDYYTSDNIKQIT